MNETLRHRGPDSDGLWLDAEVGIALGHRRLAIVDLSPAGHQPMASPSGRWVIAFNGEIYNHLDLRRDLESSGMAPGAWRGHSDTETLLACFEAWGIETTLQRSSGMFALALWDRAERVLTLARDRLGEKPLYWGWQGGPGSACPQTPRTLLFGSELKALQRHPAFEARVDRQALALLMRHNYIGAPHSIWQGLHKLEPGCWLQVSRSAPEPVIRPYWSALEVALAGQANPFDGSPDEAVDELSRLLGAAVQRQSVADVPLGAFLSGGIDSSTVVALMQAQSSQRVRTFTIGFHEEGYDEAQHARAVAQHLGTDHTELYVPAAEALAVIPKLPALYSEPFSDSSQIPTFLVSQMARQQVTVALSGDGGDELFAGYERYRLTDRYWSRLSKVPLGVRQAVGWTCTRLSSDRWNDLLDFVQSSLPANRRHRNLGDKLHKAARLMTSVDLTDLYQGMVSHSGGLQSLVLGSEDSNIGKGLVQPRGRTSEGIDDVPWMMLTDLLSYLPGDILAKVDRAAMGVSLETRVPMLDPAVVEFAWTLPLSMKLRDGVSKWPLRQLLYRHVPRELIDRPKMGFAIPLKGWLRAPLKGWAAELLDERRLRREGFFDAAQVSRKWDDHVHGRRDWQAQLWDVLMFQAWLDEQRRDGFAPLS